MSSTRGSSRASCASTHAPTRPSSPTEANRKTEPRKTEPTESPAALHVAACARGLDHALDSEQVGGLPEGDALLLGAAVDVAVGLAHDSAELVVHLALGPAEVLEVLHPL